MDSNTVNKEFDEKITTCLEYDIVNINKLLAFKDLELFNYAIDNYSFCLKDKLNKFVQDENIKGLFKYIVDHKIIDLIHLYTWINEYSETKLVDKTKETINRICNDIYKYKQRAKYYLLEVNFQYYLKSHNQNTNEVLSSVLNKLQLESIKDNKIGDITKDYLMDLFNTQTKGNYELLIIKLCSKLEAILKYDYQYNGTFDEMLTHFFNEHLRIDDDEDYCYTEYNRIRNNLSSLRILRNNIVHCTNDGKSDITLNELKFCINYICKLNNEE